MASSRKGPVTLPRRAGHLSSAPGTKSLALFCSLSLLDSPGPTRAPSSGAAQEWLLLAASHSQISGPLSWGTRSVPTVLGDRSWVGFIWRLPLLALAHSWGPLATPPGFQASFPGPLGHLPPHDCPVITPKFLTGWQSCQQLEAVASAPGALAKGPLEKVRGGESPG